GQTATLTQRVTSPLEVSLWWATGCAFTRGGQLGQPSAYSVDISPRDGMIRMFKGDLLIQQGDLAMCEGDITLNKGDITVKRGNIFLEKGADIIFVVDGNELSLRELLNLT
ncbi:MAG: hypothetical protein KC492_34530, partial [Myxococcales bacterium]|nr:hypothetical protein [Myxococcales bacterium]